MKLHLYFTVKYGKAVMQNVYVWESRRNYRAEPASVCLTLVDDPVDPAAA